MLKLVAHVLIPVMRCGMLIPWEDSTGNMNNDLVSNN